MTSEGTNASITFKGTETIIVVEQVRYISIFQPTPARPTHVTTTTKHYIYEVTDGQLLWFTPEPPAAALTVRGRVDGFWQRGDSDSEPLLDLLQNFLVCVARHERDGWWSAKTPLRSCKK